MEGILDLGHFHNTVKYKSTSGIQIYKNNGFFSFQIDQNDSFPLLTLRDINIKASVAEILWYLRGDNDPKWLQKYTKIWDSFTDEDGMVGASYGFRWRNYFKRDQIQGLINLLKQDESSRQAVVITWDPDSDGLDDNLQTEKGSKIKKNVPCLPMMHFQLLDNKFVMSCIWRSNDMYLGFPHDVLGMSLLQAVLAQELGREIGLLNYVILNGHLYENQLESARILLNSEPNLEKIKLELPINTYKIARDGSETELDDLFTAIFNNLKSQYHPVQKIKGIKVVV